MNYNYNKENLSSFRTIHNLIRDFPLFFSTELEIKIMNQAITTFRDKLAFKKKRENKFIRQHHTENSIMINIRFNSYEDYAYFKEREEYLEIFTKLVTLETKKNGDVKPFTNP